MKTKKNQSQKSYNLDIFLKFFAQSFQLCQSMESFCKSLKHIDNLSLFLFTG